MPRARGTGPIALCHIIIHTCHIIIHTGHIIIHICHIIDAESERYGSDSAVCVREMNTVKQSEHKSV